MKTITCTVCKHPKCSRCRRDTGIVATYVSARGVICNTCENIEEKKEFGRKWAKMTPVEKLKMHGKEKLQMLATNKKLKRSGTVSDLIERLTPVCTHDDFPIRR